ncbi:hypothetical protein PF008_g6109 [Phytophthora fragariae]|uniref:Secreted protein n=1 Tax=Phytophthora fragariae TaxID=53985 RepID=A0A6G0S803_9STRA|nr:hypothetical protein PF008_g6109 [Phytophthora fragariae]
MILPFVLTACCCGGCCINLSSIVASIGSKTQAPGSNGERLFFIVGEVILHVRSFCNSARSDRE